MAKTFKSSASAMEFHLNNVKEIESEFLVKLSSLVASDNNDQFVPELTADLKNSVFDGVYSKFDKGLLVWHTDYARRRFYEGSITGVAFWTLENKARNKEKYRKLIIKELKRRT